MITSLIESFSVDSLLREQAKFSDNHLTLQTELFEASEAFDILKTAKGKITRHNEYINFQQSQVYCNESEGF